MFEKFSSYKMRTAVKVGNEAKKGCSSWRIRNELLISAHISNDAENTFGVVRFTFLR